MTRKIKAVLFDYGGTLDADGIPWFNQFYPLYKEAGLDCSRDEFAPAFYAADDNLPRRFDLRGKSLAETVRLQVGCVIATLAPQRPELAERVAQAYMTRVRSHLRRNLEILRRLKPRFKLGVVSNNYGNLEDVLAAEGMREVFDVVVDSGVVGAVKPDRRMFDAALTALGLAPEEALMVGDSLPRDMEGARAIGMPHAWLKSAEDDRACPTATWTLTSLPQLADKLLCRAEAA